GLGYLVREILQFSNSRVVWMEIYPGILKHALSEFDYSVYFLSNRLKIIIKPFLEDELFSAFKGMANLPVTFIPHRGSFSWKESEYSELKFICEGFFKKKDVNIATLSRFERIWTRNIIQNFPDLLTLAPASLLFGISPNVPIIVCGAGPSLIYDILDLKKYLHRFLIIAVDTALHILTQNGIDPDLIYSVDPQALNTSYLEGYNGSGRIVFDPTSSYHTLRLSPALKGFYTSSPFPLIKLLTKHCKIEPGEIPFGGSVSTNAVSLAELMGASEVFFLGQDLSFTGGLAHCKGAILEERLNYRETRYFRREKHNYNQLTALPKKVVTSYDGKEHFTNEKMLIFLKWFQDKASGKNWVNLTSDGAKIEGIPHGNFVEYFGDDSNYGKSDPEVISLIRKKIKNLSTTPEENIETKKFLSEIERTIGELSSFERLLLRGRNLSERIYNTIRQKDIKIEKLNSELSEIDRIDEEVSSKKGLNEIIGTAVQRIILMITEGYETNLSVEEKQNEQLAIAKKSVLLYQGLYDACLLNRNLLRKVFRRMATRE
ncbi:MAG: DUF115 domain-containing protein, partial [Leptospira sp.]|nr:DUF115 domain-containing protein [Leptospira sp.]